MRFTHNEVNFNTMNEGYIKNPQNVHKMFLTIFDNFHM